MRSACTASRAISPPRAWASSSRSMRAGARATSSRRSASACDSTGGDTKPCPLFVGRYFRVVKNGPSPDWLKRRLTAIGLRPISALVDITNYITFSLWAAAACLRRRQARRRHSRAPGQGRREHYSNGNARDRQGRLVTCEHSDTRRITRTEKSGDVTVLVDSFEGKRLNAPNDIVVKSDDTIWFTDPLFGINGEWEGSRAEPEQATTNVYRVTPDKQITAVITDLVNPNGLAFSPDEKKLYVVEWKGTPNRSLWSYDVADDGTVGNKTKLIDAADQGALDGFTVDRDGNLWCGWGSNGALQEQPSDVGGRKVFQLRGKSEDLDGVMVFNPQGKAIGSSASPSGAPTSPSAGRRTTASTWRPPTRSMPSTSRPTARPERSLPRDIARSYRWTGLEV